jgi:hypothetical protein
MPTLRSEAATYAQRTEAGFEPLVYFGDPMSTDSSTEPVSTDDQRRALEEAEKKAAEKQPGSYKDQATKDKLVEIGPDPTENPIKGIDPAEDSRRRL